MGFFKLRKNKQYSYTPRYYDEKKERLNNLIKHAEEGESSTELRNRGKFKRPGQHKIPGLFSNATLRTFLILGILVVPFIIS